MMVVLAAVLAIAAFLAAFTVLGIVATARQALTTTGNAVSVMRDLALSDLEKEKAVQSAALALLKAVWHLLWRFAVCLFLAVSLIWLFDLAGLAGVDDTFGFLSRVDVLIVSTLVIGIGMIVIVKSGQRHSDYSTLDKLVHRIAFSRPFVQLTATDIEDTAFRADFESTTSHPPVFVTALPRAGTTVLLTALAEVPGLASHTYRDMPFIMAPVLWSRLGGAFRKNGKMQERAHGDGVTVGYDGPEAFEEVLWRSFWPAKYEADGISLWADADESQEHTAFFTRHFQKITALRCGAEGRYLSKNNGNIARLSLLTKMFPMATVVVPFRDPFEHAASLHRQHLNFLAPQHWECATKR